MFARGKLRSDYLSGGIYLENKLKAISVAAKVSSQIIEKPEILHRHLLQNGITDVCFLRKAWVRAFAAIFYLTLYMSRRKPSGYDLASFPSSTAFFPRCPDKQPDTDTIIGSYLYRLRSVRVK